jgi:transmembrane sensor
LLEGVGPDVASHGTGVKSKRMMQGAVGGSLILATIMACLLTGWVTDRESWISYVTSLGGYQSVPLLDGSKVELNTDTEVRARTPIRQLELMRGESLLRVAGEAQHPFVLRVRGRVVEVDPVGNVVTVFSVRLRSSQEFDVAVTEGVVLVRPEARLVDLVWGRSSASQTRVGAGELLTVRAEGARLMKVGVEEIKRRQSWTTGKLVFNGQSLTEVAAEFNRYNRKRVVVGDQSITGIKVAGTFQATDPDSFVLAALRCFPVRAQEVYPGDGSIVLLKKGQ